MQGLLWRGPLLWGLNCTHLRLGDFRRNSGKPPWMAPLPVPCLNISSPVRYRETAWLPLKTAFLHMFVCNLLTPICSISILVDLSGRSIVYERSLLYVTAGGIALCVHTKPPMLCYCAAEMGIQGRECRLHPVIGVRDGCLRGGISASCFKVPRWLERRR